MLCNWNSQVILATKRSLQVCDFYHPIKLEVTIQDNYFQNNQTQGHMLIHCFNRGLSACFWTLSCCLGPHIFFSCLYFYSFSEKATLTKERSELQWEESMRRHSYWSVALRLVHQVKHFLFFFIYSRICHSQSTVNCYTVNKATRIREERFILVAW